MAEGGEACGPEGARKSAGINTTEFQVPVRGYELLHRQFPSGCIVQNLDYDGSSFDGSIYTRVSGERERGQQYWRRVKSTEGQSAPCF